MHMCIMTCRPDRDTAIVVGQSVRMPIDLVEYDSEEGA